MQIEKEHIYHIYNQGNNKRKIFFLQRNYLFFIKKIRTYILPYADILAWCLMPNHFHIMIYVKQEYIEIKKSTIQNFPQSKTLKKRTINDAIGILLRTYTRAINKQENMTGSLFRKETKAQCVTCKEGGSPNFFNTVYGTKINIQNFKQQYPQICFDYIHQNPVKAGLVN